MSDSDLATLTERAQREADLYGSAFVPDSQWHTWINNEGKRLHDLIVSTMGTRFIEVTATITSVQDQEDYALPVDFFQLFEIDLQLPDGNYVTVFPFDEAERNVIRNNRDYVNRYYDDTYRYMLVGQNIRLLPAPRESGRTFRLRYLPFFRKLEKANDKLGPLLSQYDHYVVAGAAASAARKQQRSDQSFLLQQKMVEDDLKKMVPRRDQQTAPVISQTRRVKRLGW